MLFELLQVVKKLRFWLILYLRKIYDAVDIHTRTLLPFDINMNHYGPMLVSLLLNKFLEDFKTEISRHMPAGKRIRKIIVCF